MKVKQIYELVNSISQEVLGTSDIVDEDLNGVVDFGTTIVGSNNIDNYVKSLINHIGKMWFVDRVYTGTDYNVLRDAWDFGSILEKVTVQMPDADENASWELSDGHSYDPNVFYQPVVTAKFFNQKTTFEIDMSFTEMQVRESFSSAEELNRFFSTIYIAIDKSMTVRLQSLIKRLFNAMIATTLKTAFPGGDYSVGTSANAVNLLYEYNQTVDQADKLTKNNCIRNPKFLRFCAEVTGKYVDRLKEISTLFNVEETEKFTPPEMLNIVMLSDFIHAVNVNLEADVWHNELTALPENNLQVVPFWQGSGDKTHAYDFDRISSIDVTLPDNTEIQADGIVAIMFDRDAIAVTNQNRRVTSNYNPKAEFTTYFNKVDVQYLADSAENFVVFYIA